jgi:hypothetical protein
VSPTPSVGRIVHYNTPNGVAPAIITHVHDKDNPLDTLEGVALCVFDAWGGTYHAMGQAQGKEIGQWDWPPKV